MGTSPEKHSAAKRSMPLDFMLLQIWTTASLSYHAYLARKKFSWLPLLQATDETKNKDKHSTGRLQVVEAEMKNMKAKLTAAEDMLKKTETELDIAKTELKAAATKLAEKTSKKNKKTGLRKHVFATNSAYVLSDTGAT